MVLRKINFEDEV